MFTIKYLPYYFFTVILTIFNPFMYMDAEFIIFISLSLVILLAFINLNELISKFYFNKLIEFRYNYLKNYNTQLWSLFALNEFLNLRLFIFIIPTYLKWFFFYNTQLNFFFNKKLIVLFRFLQKLNIFYSFYFLKQLKYDLYNIFLLYFLNFKCNLKFKKYTLLNVRSMGRYLLRKKLKSINIRIRKKLKNINIRKKLKSIFISMKIKPKKIVANNNQIYIKGKNILRDILIERDEAKKIKKK
jgi:hypothetical protein